MSRIKSTISSAEVDERFDMTINEVVELKDLYGDTVDAIYSAFVFGYARGVAEATATRTGDVV